VIGYSHPIAEHGNLQEIRDILTLNQDWALEKTSVVVWWWRAAMNDSESKAESQRNCVILT